MLMILSTSLIILSSAHTHNITHLEKVNVSNWMSSIFLSLNPSKTEFLIFGLLQQLSRLNNLTIHLLNKVMLRLDRQTSTYEASTKTFNNNNAFTG